MKISKICPLRAGNAFFLVESISKHLGVAFRGAALCVCCDLGADYAPLRKKTCFLSTLTLRARGQESSLLITEVHKSSVYRSGSRLATVRARGQENSLLITEVHKSSVYRTGSRLVIRPVPELTRPV